MPVEPHALWRKTSREEKWGEPGWGQFWRKILEKQKPQHVREQVGLRGERSRPSHSEGRVLRQRCRAEGTGWSRRRQGPEGLRFCSEMGSCWEDNIWKEKGDFRLFWREFLDIQ